MGIGAYRHRVTIYEITQGPTDDIGGFDVVKTNAGIYWAKVSELSGARSQALHGADNTTGVTIDIRSGSYEITTKNIVSYMGIEYTISSITKDALKRITTVTAWAKAG